ncbi:MAG: hypothetical protein FRX49_06817 [Trebouxia sp. A1-2]|nr:MAG: hypothetical protein FRX49_06817 [Trebouxia sp. A1-2]
MDMASFQPSSTMATIAHRGGSLLLAALLASWLSPVLSVATWKRKGTCCTMKLVSEVNWRHRARDRLGLSSMAFSGTPGHWGAANPGLTELVLWGVLSSLSATLQALRAWLLQAPDKHPIKVLAACETAAAESTIGVLAALTGGENVRRSIASLATGSLGVQKVLHPGVDLLHESLQSLLDEILTVHTFDCQVVVCALPELLLSLAGPPGNAADTIQDWGPQLVIQDLPAPDVGYHDLQQMRSLGHVSEDKQQDSSPLIGGWSEELQQELSTDLENCLEKGFARACLAPNIFGPHVDQEDISNRKGKQGALAFK